MLNSPYDYAPRHDDIWGNRIADPLIVGEVKGQFEALALLTQGKDTPVLVDTMLRYKNPCPY
jgi:hypothetical protein